MTADAVESVIRRYVGGCREWIDAEANHCWVPAEYVLWGALLPREALGPRCHMHAQRYVHESGLRRNSGWAIIHIRELAERIASADA